MFQFRNFSLAVLDVCPSTEPFWTRPFKASVFQYGKLESTALWDSSFLFEMRLLAFSQESFS